MARITVFVTLLFLSMLSGCSVVDAISAGGVGLGFPLEWLSQHWTVFTAWAVPAWFFYIMGSAGYTPTTRTTSTGYDAYGVPITLHTDIPSGPYVPGERKRGYASAGWWLLVFPLGYALYPGYSEIWSQADQSTLTPYPNLNWHLIKWIFPLIMLVLSYWLVKVVVSHKNEAFVSRVVRAGYWFIWLLVMLAAVWPAYRVLGHLLERPASEIMAAPETPSKPLPVQPKDLKIPKNGEFDPYATQLWSCRVGFVQVGDTCQKK